MWLFDCDGVILDSNSIKTEAFRRAGMAYGAREADALVQYHVKHGGMSRYQKLEFFFREIVGEGEFRDKLRVALADYGRFVGSALRRCTEVPGARNFLEMLRGTEGVRTFVVSGSDEEELCAVFKERELDRYFDGIFGAPAKKRDIVADLCREETKRRGVLPPTVFCGDSQLDYEVASAFAIEFIMIYGYTEWMDWREAVRQDIICVQDFRALVPRVVV